jgi:hypothetical protein
MTNGWLEKELETYAVTHMGELFQPIIGDLPVKILGCQVRCMFGIIDLLAYQGVNLFIVEFKAVTADEKTTGQLHRYKQAICNLSLPDGYTREMMDACPMLLDFPISLVAVAPAFTDSAMRGIDVCISARKQVDRFTFERAKWPGYDRDSADSINELLRPYLAGLVAWKLGQVQRDNDSILSDSAQKRLLEVN